ncbi:MAG: hypothetical protein LBC74_11560 [Planctomycetaceae bacterium]|jgi:hypothetical protein|nr:hypothetical protein [Planctomycetaceae bacterium]
MRQLFIILLLCVFGYGHGCGQNNPYSTNYVEGVVFVDGLPMEGVNVTFSPRQPQGYSAGGVTDAAGKFKLTTGGAPVNSGALSGEYNVTFRKVQVKETTFEESQAGKQTTETYLIPAKYGDVQTSEISPVTVEKGNKNSFEFHLKTS